MKSYYDMLGVSETASTAEVRSAYRRLALRLHPDRRPDDAGADAEFKRISAAYDVLVDPEQRRRYDSQRMPKPVPRAARADHDTPAWVRVRRAPRRRGVRRVSSVQQQWWGRPVPVMMGANPVMIPGFYAFHGFRRD